MWHESKCDRCGDCLVRCQYVDYGREKAIQEITALIEGEDAEILRQCVTCIACNEYCAKGANPFDLICQLQEKRGGLPVPEAVVTEFVELAAMPAEIIKGDPAKPVLNMCLTEPLLPEGAVDGQIFKGLTIVKGSEYRSLVGMVHAGWDSPVRKSAQRFVDKMAGLGAREILFLHEDCYAMAASKAPDYGITLPFKPVHVVEYMLNHLKDHRGSITRLGKKVAYQRPCASRYTPAKEGMLDELFQLIAVERLGRKYDREEALCCCGTGFASYYPEKASAIQDMNLTDAKDHGAEAMVFSCPWCFQTLKNGCQERNIAPIFITDLCRMALGEKPSTLL